jgi:hypothetical protein
MSENDLFGLVIDQSVDCGDLLQRKSGGLRTEKQSENV